MLKDKKCIDFHAHPVTDSFRKAMVDLGIDPIEEDGFPLPKWSAEEHLAFMEEAGIDYSVLSAPVPHIYNGDAPKARKAAREINDGVAETVRRRSGSKTGRSLRRIFYWPRSSTALARAGYISATAWVGKRRRTKR